MLKKLLPIVLLLIGTGAGVGAGIYLRPAPIDLVEETDESGEVLKENESAKDADHKAKAGGQDASAKLAKDGHDDDPEAMEYVKLNNQFVVPIVKNKNVTALVVLALSLEVPAGQKDAVYLREPKVRDSILQVLFDHANIGGFDGAFTEAKTLDSLRSALREVAQRDLGTDVVNDVLILEIARQDY
jgi:flagellar basal body-associated protein FliL